VQVREVSKFAEIEREERGREREKERSERDKNRFSSKQK
jgi:hypothetical protein